METTLRPLTLGEILDRTAQLYRTNFWLFAGIFSIYSGVGLVLNLLQIGMVQLLRAEHLDKKLVWLPIAVGVLEGLVLILLLGATIAAISRAVASVHLGEPATIRGSYASTLPRLGRYIWMMIITFFLAWLPMGVLYGAFFAVVLRFKGSTAAGAAHAAQPTEQAMIMGIALVALVILMIPAFFYGLWMSIRYALAVPACVVENIKARKAIRRSIELSKGARGRIFVLLLLVGVIKIGLVLLTQSFLFIFIFKHHGEIPPAINAASQIVAFFTNTFIGPIGAAGVTLFYFDQRVRKEGYDIEWMMQAAGLNALPSTLVPEAEAPPAAEPPAILVPAPAAETPASSADPPPLGDPA